MNIQHSAGDMMPTDVRDVLGTKVLSLHRSEAIALLKEVIAQKRFTRLAFLNAHNANIACTVPDFARALDHFVVLPDGIGVDIASRVLYGDAFAENLNGTDFVPDLLREFDEPITVGLVGSRTEHGSLARDKLEAIAPNLRFVFINDGYFDVDRQDAILEELRAIKPDILLVAMGVPRQEFWISEYVTADHCTLAIGVGALFDFLSGQVARAPLWMRQLRIEWVYRLVLEPERMWRRYILGNPLFLLRVIRQKLTSHGRGR
ncbi:WecB/TagA/CpsF family glycosyltransferase [Chelativorans sp. ZYF759]|uniref:WecB/TagA/CpsF family glycosyltransferase n=1 Tax=Chelativorans sp. ZYF759 TaxID=2692213 RepID=UPI00145EF440|nr:WecB/TagA/CpsF family glycosyltransferase [Chelativorans sp. ZYF759]NMG37689.1 WecB/TagA/CpsF family glycosyltransferase [Chelativorans sp. ZYF759]